MKRLITLSLICSLFTVISLTAAVPASITRVVKQVKDAPALEVVCTINGRAASMTLSGQCFRFDLGNAQVYYDGVTQWSYSPIDKEVTLLTPTAEEVAESNPLGILASLEKDFDGVAVTGKANTVRLTPKNPRGPIAEATITFSPTSGWPTHITLISGGRRAEITNLRFSPSATKRPASSFQFNPPKGTTITDLR
ncbi:MAG: outer membrane lipoprotein carrier protein LolA [Bacteroides sp.]|nr:outer membrane lipoprotein carrier protein LolA [Bacteroides sp.]MCM1380147.1 outer membrane lipoprotein carrier protein LolA [Bacteroides sp.]MCM1445731.1 outer membrane lipoprotein carrier protein LolA [Prevotella sp.]